jgi:hypothetical protein
VVDKGAAVVDKADEQVPAPEKKSATNANPAQPVAGNEGVSDKPNTSQKEEASASELPIVGETPKTVTKVRKTPDSQTLTEEAD